MRHNYDANEAKKRNGLKALPQNFVLTFWQI